MRAVLGIGNPGKKYQRTKHNIGLIILDDLTQELKLRFEKSKSDYYLARGINNASRFVFIHPTTYVNNTGLAAKNVVENLSIEIKDLLILVDDLNLPLGNVRFRHHGGDGGHNGLKSIIYHLNSNNFPRLRVGIGNDFNEGEMANYVLGEFNKKEEKILSNSVKYSKTLILNFISGGTKKLLNFLSESSKNNISCPSDIKCEGI